jgi:hypothetical protein
MKAILEKLANLEMNDNSRVIDSEQFLYCSIPLDFKVLGALRHSPLQMNLYIWLTFYLPFLKDRTLVPWFNLKKHLHCTSETSTQSLEVFKKKILKALKVVRSFYSEARVEFHDNGMLIYPSPPHNKPSYMNQFY